MYLHENETFWHFKYPSLMYNVIIIAFWINKQKTFWKPTNTKKKYFQICMQERKYSLLSSQMSLRKFTFHIFRVLANRKLSFYPFFLFAVIKNKLFKVKVTLRRIHRKKPNLLKNLLHQTKEHQKKNQLTNEF